MKFIKTDPLYTNSFGDKDFYLGADSEIKKGWDNKGLALGLLGENSSGVHQYASQIRIMSEDPINDGTHNKTFSVGISLDINTREIFDENDVEIDYDNPPVREKINGNKQLIMKLRQIDYCDVDGNEKKILVFASEPFEVEP
jgi:hypothetical protein